MFNKIKTLFKKNKKTEVQQDPIQECIDATVDDILQESSDDSCLTIKYGIVGDPNIYEIRFGDEEGFNKVMSNKNAYLIFD